MMKKIGIALTALAFGMLSGCNGGTSDTADDRPEKITEEPMMQQEVEQDTTLQDVEEVTIKASGDDVQTTSFDQDTLEVKANSLVRVTLDNESSDPTMIHNIVFTDSGRYKQVAAAGARAGASGNYIPNNETIIAASPLALPGQTVEIEFTAPERPGNYEFVCTYPDHSRNEHGLLVIK